MSERLKAQARLAIIGRDLGKILKEELPDDVKFVMVLIDDEGNVGSVSYPSTFERVDVPDILRELADDWLPPQEN